MTAPPRPSRAFERHLDRVAEGRIVQFPRCVTRTLPMDDCTGPAFASKQPAKIDWSAVCMAAGVCLCVGAAITLAGLAGLLSIGWRP